jgi:hypothetical protein
MMKQITHEKIGTIGNPLESCWKAFGNVFPSYFQKEYVTLKRY